MDLGDGAVVRRVLAGDAEAYRHLVTRYRTLYARYAVALVGDADAAADAMQEALIRAFDGLASCRDPDRFGSWFHRILTNQCHTARERMRPTESVEALELASRERPDEDLDRRELAGQLRAALGQLTDEQREAFVLKHVDGRSYEEIAAMTGARVDALKMRVYRAREALRTAMGATR